MIKRLYVLAISLIITSVAIVTCTQTRKEVVRLESNQAVLLEDVQFYRTKDSLSVASVGQLNLTLSEYERNFKDLNKIINDLNIENKRLETVARTAMEASFAIHTEWKDSIVYKPGSVDTLRSVNYMDNYLTFRAIDRGSFLDSYVSIKDTLIQAVHRVPNEFWFIKYGTKGIRQEIMSRNPYSTITYTEYISFERGGVFDRKRPVVSVGLQAGYGVTRNGLSPYIGAGVSLNLISF